jgi:signal transduction histidine kinase
MAAAPRFPPRLLWIIATGFGVSSTLQAYWVQQLVTDYTVPYLIPRLLALNLVYWYVPALVAPLIMAYALRYELGRVRWPTQIGVHLAGVVVYSIGHTAIMRGAKALLLPAGDYPPGLWTWLALAAHEYLVQLDWLLMTYLFLVGLAHALAYRRASEAAELNAAHLETRLAEAQLQALQRQLHPHFLFNTLNTISGLVQTDPKAADLMIDRLGDLLRMTLRSSGLQEVALKEELEVLQKYLEIEQTRFGDRLQVMMDIEPDALDARVPSLLLQPLVENAIRHGVAPSARPGWVGIRASRFGSQLMVHIRDSGPGLPPERLLALNRGVGIDNTRARLEHLYRGAYQLEFANQDDGFCVTVRIPFNLAQEPAQRDVA